MPRLHPCVPKHEPTRPRRRDTQNAVSRGPCKPKSGATALAQPTLRTDLVQSTESDPTRPAVRGLNRNPPESRVDVGLEQPWDLPQYRHEHPYEDMGTTKEERCALDLRTAASLSSVSWRSFSVMWTWPLMLPSRPSPFADLQQTPTATEKRGQPKADEPTHSSP